MSSSRPILSLFRLSRPAFLLGGIGQYALGVGIARYLGHRLDWGAAVLGLVWVLALQLTAHYLNEYYDAPQDNSRERSSQFSGGSGVLGDGEGQLPRQVGMVAAGSVLTVAALVTIWLIRLGALNGGLVVIMALIFLGSIFYSTPPVRLNRSGYGELSTAVLVGYLVPSFGFMLQSGINHRLVLMSTLPLVFLMLALQLAVAFPDYATDLKYQKRNLLVRAGWENGMLLHNTFVLLAFVVLGLAGVTGLPLGIGLPAFIPLPLGLLQIWYMRRIAQGAPPNWRALTLNAMALVGIMTYLFIFAFWSR